MELRLQRLQFAHCTLADSEDLRQRIFAAYAVDFDGQVLSAFLQQARKSQAQGGFALSRPRLRDDRLPAKVQKLAESGRDLAGDLVEKSRLFFDGLHWWMRGRYGRGTEGNGLLKSPEALNSPLAQMALFMPTEPPQPIDPFADGDLRTPEVDRRHYYTWATEQPRFRTTITYFH
jgi:hypothetical protein